MKFAPRRSQIIGRMLIEKSQSLIITIDETRVTKYLLVDAVGVEAAAVGIKVGDVVVPKAVGHMILKNGTIYSPWIEEKDIGVFAKDWSLDDFLVQTHSGKQFVPFDSPEAMESLAWTSDVRETSQAAE